MFVYNKH